MIHFVKESTVKLSLLFGDPSGRHLNGHTKQVVLQIVFFFGSVQTLSFIKQHNHAIVIILCTILVNWISSAHKEKWG